MVGDGRPQMLLMGGLRAFEVLLRWPEGAVEEADRCRAYPRSRTKLVDRTGCRLCGLAGLRRHDSLDVEADRFRSLSRYRHLDARDCRFGVCGESAADDG